MPAATRSAAAVTHRLLFDSLVQMRAEGHDRGDKVVFHLADLFHGVALDLLAAAEGELGYDEVLSRLEAKAAEKGCGRWLASALARAEAPDAEAGAAGGPHFGAV